MKEDRMKKVFGPAWLTAWLAGIRPDGFFFIGKKTPWYRQSWMQFAPWIGAALMAPFTVFAVWKGVKALTSGNQEAGSH
jgi:hypothetical protein